MFDAIDIGTGASLWFPENRNPKLPTQINEVATRKTRQFRRLTKSQSRAPIELDGQEVQRVLVDVGAAPAFVASTIIEKSDHPCGSPCANRLVDLAYYGANRLDLLAYYGAEENLVIEQFGRQNRWWMDPALVARDPHLRRLNESPLKWTPSLPFQFDRDAVYVLRGPRQVGKSTVLKRLVEQLLKDDWNPRRILYLDVELGGLTSAKDLVNALREFIDFARSTPTERPERLAILLDEATRVAHWAGAIRGLIDNGEFENVTLIATGSHTTDLREGGERLPGRRGGGSELDLQLLPLSFREYLQLVHPLVALPATINSLGIEEVAAGQTDRMGVRQLLPPLFTRYLTTGGFLAALNDEALTGAIQPDTYRYYREALIGEFTRAGFREAYLREVVNWLADHLGQEFDSRGIAADTDIGSKDTARGYVQHLVDTYAIDVFYRATSLVDPRPAFRAPKKMHPIDPLVFHMLRAWAASDPDPWLATQTTLERPGDMGHLVESISSVHLRRAFGERVFYLRQERGKEIDIVIGRPDSSSVLGEIKYRNTFDESDVAELFRYGGVVLTRNTVGWLADKRVYTLPTAELLACIRAPALAPFAM